MMRVLVIAGILLFNIIVQSAIFPFIRIGGIGPDTLMVITLAFALQTGSIRGAIVGFTGGLLQDILFADVLGLNALIYMLIGYIAGLLYDRVFIDKLFLPIFFVFLATLLKDFLNLVYLFFRGTQTSFSFAFARYILPEAIYTIILTPLFYYLLYQLNEKKFMNQKWHFRSD
ncbi:MAG: rod shape-determining protein MreD [Caldicoprobacterales bacterium]